MVVKPLANLSEDRKGSEQAGTAEAAAQSVTETRWVREPNDGTSLTLQEFGYAVQRQDVEVLCRVN